jgi:hypothetical protein
VAQQKGVANGDAQLHLLYGIREEIVQKGLEDLASVLLQQQLPRSLALSRAGNLQGGVPLRGVKAEARLP